MDLIYTNEKRIDQGCLFAYAFDLSFGESENDYELTLGVNDPSLKFGALVYIEGTEYGGMVDGIKAASNSRSVTYSGRTWHGILNSKVIQPDSGADYFVVSGDANDVLSTLIARLGLSGLFVADESTSGVTISSYKFHRYCKAYDGIRALLSTHGAKLKMLWKNRAVVLSAEPIANYTDSPVDGDIASLTVNQKGKKVNHLICLGRGDLAEREVIHLYVDQFGRIGDVQYFTGLDEITDTYDNSNAESSEELRSGGVDRLKELLDTDTAEINVYEDDVLFYDIGDIVGASEVKSAVTVSAVVSQKIVRINNGAVRTEYKTGG